jgi:transcriptional regulator with XRE-family HTH domain
MKFKDKYKISSEFEDIFAFDSEEEELEHDAQMLTYKFLEELEKCHSNGPKFKKKDLARAIEKSPSFISQLYSGEKLMSFNLLAKIQKAFNISFEIKAKSNSVDYGTKAPTANDFNFQNEPDGFWIWMNKNADYSKADECCETYDKPETEITAA